MLNRFRLQLFILLLSLLRKSQGFIKCVGNDQVPHLTGKSYPAQIPYCCPPGYDLNENYSCEKIDCLHSRGEFYESVNGEVDGSTSSDSTKYTTGNEDHHNHLPLIERCPLELLTNEDQSLHQSAKENRQVDVNELHFEYVSRNLGKFMITPIDDQDGVIVMGVARKVQHPTVTTFVSINTTKSSSRSDDNKPDQEENDKSRGERRNFDIPQAFCLGRKLLDRKIREKRSLVRAIICPRRRFEGKAKVEKCCPFGHQIQLASSTKTKIDDFSVKCVPNPEYRPEFYTAPLWRLYLNGYPFELQELLRFPYESVVHRARDASPLGHFNGSCADGRPLFDYEAFIINKQGHLAFNRALKTTTTSSDSKEEIKSKTSLARLPTATTSATDRFCVDITRVPRSNKKQMKTRRKKDKISENPYAMLAVFCVSDGEPYSTEAMDFSMPSNEAVTTSTYAAAQQTIPIMLTSLWIRFFHSPLQ